MEDHRKRTSLRKSLQLYLSRTLKKIPPIHIPSSAAIIPANITSARLLSTCRFPRTPSLDLDGDHAAAAAAGVDDDDDSSKGKEDQAATLSDVDRFLFDNFRSLYIHDSKDPPSSAGTSTTSVVNETPPSAAVETSSSSESTSKEGVKEVRPNEEEEGGDNNAAIVVFSMDPYTDFRRSMQSMIKMHHGCLCQPLDWDFLEELLFFYLQLNDKAVHKHILKAFADLTAETHTAGQFNPRK